MFFCPPSQWFIMMERKRTTPQEIINSDVLPGVEHITSAPDMSPPMRPRKGQRSSSSSLRFLGGVPVVLKGHSQWCLENCVVLGLGYGLQLCTVPPSLWSEFWGVPDQTEVPMSPEDGSLAEAGSQTPISQNTLLGPSIGQC